MLFRSNICCSESFRSGGIFGRSLLIETAFALNLLAVDERDAEGVGELSLCWRDDNVEM